nr:hypothetical protein CFP56_23802 [Quercus suber]
MKAIGDNHDECEWRIQEEAHNHGFRDGGRCINYLFGKMSDGFTTVSQCVRGDRVPSCRSRNLPSECDKNARNLSDQACPSSARPSAPVLPEVEKDAMGGYSRAQNPKRYDYEHKSKNMAGSKDTASRAHVFGCEDIE